jgi:hypothetical protein
MLYSQPNSLNNEQQHHQSYPIDGLNHATSYPPITNRPFYSSQSLHPANYNPHEPSNHTTNQSMVNLRDDQVVRIVQHPSPINNKITSNMEVVLKTRDLIYSWSIGIFLPLIIFTYYMIAPSIIHNVPITDCKITSNPSQYNISFSDCVSCNGQPTATEIKVKPIIAWGIFAWWVTLNFVSILITIYHIGLVWISKGVFLINVSVRKQVTNLILISVLIFVALSVPANDKTTLIEQVMDCYQTARGLVNRRPNDNQSPIFSILIVADASKLNLDSSYSFIPLLVSAMALVVFSYGLLTEIYSKLSLNDFFPNSINYNSIGFIEVGNFSNFKMLILGKGIYTMIFRTCFRRTDTNIIEINKDVFDDLFSIRKIIHKNLINIEFRNMSCGPCFISNYAEIDGRGKIVSYGKELWDKINKLPDHPVMVL